MAKNSKKTEQILCPTCKNYTDHKLRSSYASSWSDDDADVEGGASNDFFECMGCHTPTLRVTGWFSEEPGEHSVAYYPPRGEKQLSRIPKDFDNVPFGSPLESVYRQTITAFNTQLPTLVAAGVRLLVEGICKDRGVKSGLLFDANGKPRVNRAGNQIKSSDLEGKINGLVEHGYISKNDAGSLHEIRLLVVSVKMRTFGFVAVP